MSEFAGFVHHFTMARQPTRTWHTACGYSVLVVDAHATHIDLVTCPTCLAMADHYRSPADFGRNSGAAVPQEDDSQHGLESHQECTP